MGKSAPLTTEENARLENFNANLLYSTKSWNPIVRFRIKIKALEVEIHQLERVKGERNIHRYKYAHMYNIHACVQT